MRRRIRRESKTIKQMVDLYCRENHYSDGLCAQCSALLEYTQQRVEKCPFQEGKTTCAQCPVHYYAPEMREQIKKSMRYSGPRMIYRHAIAALWHIIDRIRKEPISQKSKIVDKK